MFGASGAGTATGGAGAASDAASDTGALMRRSVGAGAACGTFAAAGLRASWRGCDARARSGATIAAGSDAICVGAGGVRLSRCTTIVRGVSRASMRVFCACISHNTSAACSARTTANATANACAPRAFASRRAWAKKVGSCMVNESHPITSTHSATPPTRHAAPPRRRTARSWDSRRRTCGRAP